MFRLLVRAAANTARNTIAVAPKNYLNGPAVSTFRNLSHFMQNPLQTPAVGLLSHPKVITINNNIISRNVIKFSMRKGRRKTVGTVLKRFYRLNWGIWIRTKAGRHKKLWKKTSSRKRRLRQHVFCNATQSRLLDKMVGKYWRRPRFYVDDPYEPYHTREEYELSSRKPRPYIPSNQS